ncbi:MAG: type II secretion system secretin GspD [Pseudomonadota bacterium]|nr:MAG: type II secretion system secretin GspD [Pseudomonadota bacterium]
MRRAFLALACWALLALPVADAADEKLTFNFTDADINAVIAMISQKTGINFIVDPRVKGKVTIISHSELDADQAYQVFLSVLKVHGYAAIPGPNVTKIVPEVSAKQDAVTNVNARDPGEGDQFVSRVVEVKHVDAAQLVPILRPLVPQRGHLAAYPSSNMLVISDSAANIQRLVQIIRRIDQSTSSEVEVIPLTYASATEIVRILEQLVSKDPKAKAAGMKLSVIADDRTNSILLSGDKNQRLRIRGIIAHLDSSVEIGGTTHVVYLRHANAKDLVAVLTGVSQSLVGAKKGAAKAGAKGAAAAGFQGAVSIQADESTNALVINAPPDLFRSLRAVIQKLDVRRAQVLVEAVIAEVSFNLSRELGVQWIVNGLDSGNVIGLINFAVGTPVTSLLAVDPASPPSLTGLNVGVGDTSGSTQFGALITALAGDGDTNILSTPSILTLDNEQAEVVVGQNVPFVTGSFSTVGGGATPDNPFQTIQREDVGLTLKIKPQINEGNTIKLEVEQEISTISPSQAAVDVITNKRSIKTNVMVDDGQIVVLGGLIQDELRETEQRVPGLGDIPVLGWLFKYHKTEKTKTNYYVFLHPNIVRNTLTQTGFATEKYNYVRDQQLSYREKGVGLLKDEAAPLMPEFKAYLSLPPAYEDTEFGHDVLLPPREQTVAE